MKKKNNSNFNIKLKSTPRMHNYWSMPYGGRQEKTHQNKSERKTKTVKQREFYGKQCNEKS